MPLYMVTVTGRGVRRALVYTALAVAVVLAVAAVAGIPVAVLVLMSITGGVWAVLRVLSAGHP